MFAYNEIKVGTRVLQSFCLIQQRNRVNPDRVAVCKNDKFELFFYWTIQ